MIQLLTATANFISAIVLKAYYCCSYEWITTHQHYNCTRAWNASQGIQFFNVGNIAKKFMPRLSCRLETLQKKHRVRDFNNTSVWNGLKPEKQRPDIRNRRHWLKSGLPSLWWQSILVFVKTTSSPIADFYCFEWETNLDWRRRYTNILKRLSHDLHILEQSLVDTAWQTFVRIFLSALKASIKDFCSKLVANILFQPSLKDLGKCNLFGEPCHCFERESLVFTRTDNSITWIWCGHWRLTNSQTVLINNTHSTCPLLNVSLWKRSKLTGFTSTALAFECRNFRCCFNVR